jgi:hypothetical protein
MSTFDVYITGNVEKAKVPTSPAPSLAPKVKSNGRKAYSKQYSVESV